MSISRDMVAAALGVFALCALLVVGIVFLVCALIDCTRRHEEDPVGSLVEEEREIERKLKEAEVGK